MVAFFHNNHQHCLPGMFGTREWEGCGSLGWRLGTHSLLWARCHVSFGGALTSDMKNSLYQAAAGVIDLLGLSGWNKAKLTQLEAACLESKYPTWRKKRIVSLSPLFLSLLLCLFAFVPAGMKQKHLESFWGKLLRIIRGYRHMNGGLLFVEGHSIMMSLDKLFPLSCTSSAIRIKWPSLSQAIGTNQDHLWNWDPECHMWHDNTDLTCSSQID